MPYFNSIMMAISDVVIVACSILGFLISLYFTLVYYNVIPPDVRFVPSFCRLDEATCRFLMGTRNAKILGVRNFVLGVSYYAALIIYVATNGFDKTIPLSVMMVISSFTVLLGMYLVYGLIAKLKTHCVLCYTSHACNMVIFIALVARSAE